MVRKARKVIKKNVDILRKAEEGWGLYSEGCSGLKKEGW
jgi:hypothetical protein